MIRSTEPRPFTLDDMKGRRRPLIIFAPTIDNDGYVRQKQMLASQAGGVIDRDIAVLEICGNHEVHLDDQPLDPAVARQLRSDLNVSLDAFTVILIGKDGIPKLRDHRPVPAHRLFDLIDSIPMRELEAGGMR